MRILPFFMRHYQPWVSRFVILDDNSADGSLEYLSRFGNVEVRRFERRHSDSLVASHRNLYDECWQESRGRADWVIVTNLDEHLFHPNLGRYLASCKKAGVTAIPGLGCQMVCDDFPPAGSHLCRVVTHGMPWLNMNKLSLFNPNEITATNYDVGRHKADPEGNVVYPVRDELLNLHFKYLGLPYLVERSAELKTGLRSRDIKNRWGHKYLWRKEEIERDFIAVKANSVDVMNSQPTDLVTRRWWRTD